MAECSRGDECPRARLRGRTVSRAGRVGLAVVTGLFIGSLTRAAGADEAQELELGKNRFDAGQYEEAVKRFTTMLDPSVAPCEKSAPKKSGRCRLTDKVLIERARAFAAASLVALGRIPEADAHIETIFRQNPTYAPNPALFPFEVIDRFTEVKARIRAELEAIARKEAEIALQKRLAEQKAEEDKRRWLAEIQRLAGQERVVQKNSRLVAAVPFGVGQFQNGSPGLGWFFAISEAVTGAAALTFAGVFSYYVSIDLTTIDPDTGAPVDRAALNSAMRTAATLNQVAFGTWAALTVAGIVQAQIAFVPEVVTTVKRPVPKPPPTLDERKSAPVSMVPVVSVVPGGAGLGVVGRF
ncbi:MAG: hypothetical protein HUU21_31820 [Polyangiaceae bacterium]|nr:hypothetical protein [Polyangiaceae bacterium]